MSIALEGFRKELNIGIYGKGHDDVERLLMVINGGTELPHPRLMYEAPPYYGLRSEILTAAQAANIPWFKNSKQAMEQYNSANSDIVARPTKLAARLLDMLHMSVKDIYFWLKRNACEVLSESMPREWLNVHGTLMWLRGYDDECNEFGDSVEPYLEFIVPTDYKDADDVPIYMWYTIYASSLDAYMPFLTMGVEVVEHYHACVEKLSKQQLTYVLCALLKDDPSAFTRLTSSKDWKDSQL